LRDGDAETRKKETDSGRQRRKICGMQEGRIEHIMSHTRIKIGLGEVLDERGKGVVTWMREVKRLREVHRREIEWKRV